MQKEEYESNKDADIVVLKEDEGEDQDKYLEIN